MPPRVHEALMDSDLDMAVWSEDRITLKVYRGRGDTFCTKYGMHTPLSSLFSLYCLSNDMNPASTMFSFRGRIQPWQTPKQVGMYDGCVITAYSGDAINLVVRCPDGDAHYITGSSIPLRKLFETFRSKYATLGATNFQIGDVTVDDWSITPKQLGMKDGDVIRALVSNSPESIIMIGLNLYGTQTCCRIRRSSSLGVLFDAFCKKIGRSRSETKFLFGMNQVELYDDCTIADAGILDNDVISVYTNINHGVY